MSRCSALRKPWPSSLGILWARLDQPHVLARASE